MVEVSNRPWGKFEQFTLNAQSTVKIITVNPAQRLSVQYHHNRDELWVGLDEGLIATIDGEQRFLVGGQEVFIGRGKTHTIENRGYHPARFLEISFGHFDEADIVRISDKYGRA